jgi:Nucleotidyltransferase/DNA polymerase involved in DNA repair
VQPNRELKSVGAEDTFAHDLTTLEEMELELEKIAVLVHKRLKRNGLLRKNHYPKDQIPRLQTNHAKPFLYRTGESLGDHYQHSKTIIALY